MNWLNSLIPTGSCDCHQNILQCKTAEFSQVRLKGLKYYLNIFLTIWIHISKILLCGVLQILEGEQNTNDWSGWISMDTISQIKPAERQVVPQNEILCSNVCLAPYAKKGPKYRWWQPGTVGWMKKWPNKQFTKNLAKKRQQGSPHMPYVCRTNKQNQQSTGFLQAQKR